MCLPWNHKWIEKERFLVTRTYTYTGEVVKNIPVVIQECQKCGKLKKVDLLN